MFEFSKIVYARAAKFFFLTPIFFLVGCGTITSYKSNLPAGPAKADNFPIPVFMDEAENSIPRPYEIIGTVSFHDTILTYGTKPIEKVLLDIIRLAQTKGADAIQITSLEKPEVSNQNYRLTANLLRYTNAWETIPISENEFRAYLKKNARSLDPIEGIWSENGIVPEQIGIMKNKSGGRDFVGFILNSQNPAWPAGAKKMEIRSNQSGSYNLTFYLADFEPRETTIRLSNKRTFTLAVQRTDDAGDLIVFIKN